MQPFSHHTDVVQPIPCLVRVACLIATFVFVTPHNPTFASPPNIIIIYTDDQGFGDMSCQNPKAKFQTPNLDRLAESGIRFTNAHSSDTVCTPSRYGLLTGRYCWRTTLKRGVMGAEGKCLIADGRMTIATMLRDRGYRTAMVGKWHLGMDFPGAPGSRDWSKPVLDMPLDKGFDYFFGVPASLNYGVLAWFEGRYAEVPPTVFTNKKPNQRHVDYRIMPPYQSTPTATKKVLGRMGMEVAPDFIDNECLDRFTTQSITWIDQHTKKADPEPFFLYLPFTSPHYPVCPREEFWGRGKCGGYGEFMIETDHHVGRIMQFLQSKGLQENTMIVFTSDNGPEKSYVGRIDEFNHDSRGVWRGGKRDIYEGGHRVPFIISWPQGIKDPGRVNTDLVGQIDLLATIAEITGKADLGKWGEDSQSFASILSDPKYAHLRLPLVNHGVRGRFAVTDGPWKLILPQGKTKMELYHLGQDPKEQRNIADGNPAVVQKLRGAITGIVKSGRTTQGAESRNDTPPWEDLQWILASPK